MTDIHLNHIKINLNSINSNALLIKKKKNFLIQITLINTFHDLQYIQL